MFDHFDFLAPIYDRLIGPPEVERLTELLRLPVPGRLLDVGGGTGRASTQLTPLVDRLIVADFSKKMLLQARDKTGLCPLQTRAEQLPFANNNFDRILVVDALHHFQNQHQAIGELLRVLKPGGRLLIEEPDINRFGVKLIALAEKLMLMGSHFYSPTEICAIISQYGFSANIVSDNKLSAWVVVDK